VCRFCLCVSTKDTTFLSSPQRLKLDMLCMKYDLLAMLTTLCCVVVVVVVVVVLC